jgi:hypothetical protein
MTPFYIGNAIKRQQKYARKNRFLNIIFLASIIFSIFVYLVEANFISASSFKIAALKERVKELESSNQLMEIEVSKLESISNLDLAVEKLNFVKIAQADYLSIPVTAVAAK